jgi:hypothetical protein
VVGAEVGSAVGSAAGMDVDVGVCSFAPQALTSSTMTNVKGIAVFFISFLSSILISPISLMAVKKPGFCRSAYSKTRFLAALSTRQDG